MRVDALHYDLPPELIAQHPAEQRALARLMHLRPRECVPEHGRIGDLPELLSAGALLVVNDTRVIPARLLGRKKATGGRVEVLLVRRLRVRDVEVSPGCVRSVEVWAAVGKGRKPLKCGMDIEIPCRVSCAAQQSAPGPVSPLLVRLLGRSQDDGLLEVALWTADGEPIDASLRACGTVPLPPYIKREAEPGDADRYQTVYACHDGAVAAPTAGLHLTHEILGQLIARGCDVARVTLHVGLGTFRPVVVEDLDSHPMHAERYVVSLSTAEAVANARRRGVPVVAVGTTTARALESAADPNHMGHVLASSGETRLLVQPGYQWRVVDGLLTNFHVPRSTLLALVCALGGTERVIEAYRLAVGERYRFFSYGDAMLLWRSV